MEYYGDSPLINYGAASLPDTMYVAPEEVYAPEAVYYTPPPVYSQEVIYTPESSPLDLGGWDYARYVADQRALTAQRQQQQSLLDEYIAQQAAKGSEYVPLNPYASSGIDAINYDIYNAMNPVTPENVASRAGQVFRFSTDSDNAGNAPAVLAPGSTYTLTDYNGNVIGTASTPEQMQSLVDASQKMDASGWKLFSNQGVYSEPGSSPTDARNEVFSNSPQDNTLKTIAMLAATAMGGAGLGPALSGTGSLGIGVSPAVGAGIGAAGANMATNAAMGGSLEDVLTQGAIAGLTAGLLQGPAGEAISKGIGNIPIVGDAWNAASKAFMPDQVVQSIGDEIVVQAARNAISPIVGSTIAAISGTPFTGLTQSDVANLGVQEPSVIEQPAAEPAPQPDEIVVPGRRVEEALNIFRANPGISVGNALFRDFSVDDVLDAARQHEAEQDIVVKAQKPEPVAPPVSGIGSAIVQPSPDIPEFVAPPEDTIVVENKPEPVPPPLTPVEISGPETGISPKDAETIQNTQPEKKGLSTLDYVRLGLLAPRLISGVADLLGGGDNTVITPEQSRVNYNPLNRQQTISGIGGAPFDVFTYGQNKPGAQQGEYAFFKPYTTSIGQQTYIPIGSYDRYTQADVDAANAAKMQAYNTQLGNFNTYQDTLAQQVGAGAVTPEQAKAMAQQYATGLGYEAAIPALKDGGSADGDGEMSDEMVRHLVEWNRGNGHRGPGHVKGIGSGQEDLIPAWLSDGEYVWSAQDVADLGDGSTDEGVRRLDKMRQMVRGRAGRKDVKKIAKPQRGIEHMLKAVGGKV